LIGVPEYSIDAITPLKFVQNDILKLEEAFESSDYLVYSVGLKENLTSGVIRQHIHKFCVKEATAGDTIILCFSGHGLHYNGSDYLVPSDVYIEDIDNIADYLVFSFQNIIAIFNR
jgi:uncharacterized caspase-like protein